MSWTIPSCWAFTSAACLHHRHPRYARPCLHEFQLCKGPNYSMTAVMLKDNYFLAILCARCSWCLVQASQQSLSSASFLSGCRINLSAGRPVAASSVRLCSSALPSHSNTPGRSLHSYAGRVATSGRQQHAPSGEATRSDTHAPSAASPLLTCEGGIRGAMALTPCRSPTPSWAASCKLPYPEQHPVVWKAVWGCT